jgi:hypothetical protein
MRFDDFFGRVHTTPAARTDGQMHLQFGDGSDAAVDDFANLPIGYGVADADVHGMPRLPNRAQSLLRSGRKCECFLLGYLAGL